jgi:serine/threonine protein kinase
MSIEKSRSADPLDSDWSRWMASTTVSPSTPDNFDPEPQDPLPAAVGKYRPIRRLGVGAMGTVYLCSQPGLERPVAVKVMIAGRHASTEQIIRFQREAWAAAQLTHPNVLQIYDLGNEGELNYLVMEYVDGWSLDQLIGLPILTQERSLRLVAQVARALHSAHSQGIIHRDIKPSNILINREGQPKLADFGLAKSLQDSQDLSGSGDIIGTPRYMSPEQALAVPSDVDHRADLYSLGAVMYEMLTGLPPVDGPNALTILRNLIDEEPLPVRARNPEIPEEVAATCERAMARDKDARFASAAEFAEAIEAHLQFDQAGNGSAFASKPRSPVSESQELAAASPNAPAWRRRAAMVAVVVGAAALLGLGVTARSLSRPRVGLESGQDAPAEELREMANRGDPAPIQRPLPADIQPSAPRAARKPPVSAIDRANATLALARQLLQLGGSQSLARATAPRDRLKSLIEDLTSVVKTEPENIEVRYLRGCAFRRSGEPSAATLDLAQILRRDPSHHDARTEHLLANYQLHVLYLGNLNERALRPIRTEQVEEDVRILLKHGDPTQRYLARLIEVLARHDDDEAGKLAEAGIPAGVHSEDLADVQMVEADALFHSAEAVYRTEQTAASGDAPESEKERLKQRLQKLARQAVSALTQGLNVDPNHVGLLFLKADSIRRLAIWDTADDDDQQMANRRQRLAFDAALDRLRHTALIGGCDHAIARAVLLSNFNRDNQALDRINDALSCQPSVAFLHTIKAWLRLQAPPDGLLTVEEIDRILNDFETAVVRSDDFNPYFVRGLLHTAAGRWQEARSELRLCHRQLGKQGQDSLPTNVSTFNDWLVKANKAPLSKYIYSTSDVLGYLPVAEDQRIRLAETVLKRLDDPKLMQEETLGDDEIKSMKGWTHYRLATSFAAKNDRQGVLQHVRAALELCRPDLTAKTFREDQALSAWNGDPDFAKLYQEFDKPVSDPPAAGNESTAQNCGV